MKKIISLALALLLLLSFSSPALASSVEITTTVPSSHTVTVNSGYHGHVTVNGVEYSGEASFTVARHASFAVTAVPDSGYVSSFSFSGSTDGIVLDANSSNVATIDKVCGDVVITVSFALQGSSTPTPSPFPSPTPTPTPTPLPPLTPVRPLAPVNPANTVKPAATPKPSATPKPEATTTPENVVIPLTGKDLSMTASATVTGSTAEVNVDLDKLEIMMRSDKEATTVTIDVTSVESDINSVIIPMSTVKAVTEQTALDSNNMSGLDIVMRHASVTFDSGALNAIAEQISEDTVTLRIEEIEPQRLNPIQQEAISSSAGNPLIVEITLSSNDSGIHDFNGGNAIVCLPYVPTAGEDASTITVWYMAEDGKMEELPCHFQDNFVVFTVSHFSNYVIRPGIVLPVQVTVTPTLPVEQTAHAHTFWSWLIPLLLAITILAVLRYMYVRRRNRD